MNSVKIIERDEWGAAPPRGSFSRMQQVLGFTVHHTAGKQEMDGAARVRQIQRDHQAPKPLGNGWVDIGYHFLIDGGGDTYRGRPTVDGMLVHGAHAPGVNHTHAGICLLGCFHPPAGRCNDTPTVAQVDALVELCGHLTLRYWIESPELGGHRDYRTTDCPGDRLYEMLDRVRGRIGGFRTVILPTPTAP